MHRLLRFGWPGGGHDGDRQLAVSDDVRHAALTLGSTPVRVTPGKPMAGSEGNSVGLTETEGRV